MLLMPLLLLLVLMGPISVATVPSVRSLSVSLSLCLSVRSDKREDKGCRIWTLIQPQKMQQVRRRRRSGRVGGGSVVSVGKIRSNLNKSLSFSLSLSLPPPSSVIYTSIMQSLSVFSYQLKLRSVGRSQVGSVYGTRYITARSGWGGHRFLVREQKKKTVLDSVQSIVGLLLRVQDNRKWAPATDSVRWWLQQQQQLFFRRKSLSLDDVDCWFYLFMYLFIYFLILSVTCWFAIRSIEVGQPLQVFRGVGWPLSIASQLDSTNNNNNNNKN